MAGAVGDGEREDDSGSMTEDDDTSMGEADYTSTDDNYTSHGGGDEEEDEGITSDDDSEGGLEVSVVALNIFYVRRSEACQRPH